MCAESEREDVLGDQSRLDDLRERIVALDDQLIHLIGERRALAIEIGEAKAALGMPILDPSREAEVVRRAAQRARTLKVDEELTRDVIWRIIASARDAQRGKTRWGPPPPREVGDGESSG